MNTNRRLFLKYGAAAGAGVFASGLHPWSRMAWRRAHAKGAGARLYAGGSQYPMPVRDAKRLAAAERVNGALYESLGREGRDAVFALFDAGHLHLQLDEDQP